MLTKVLIMLWWIAGAAAASVDQTPNSTASPPIPSQEEIEANHRAAAERLLYDFADLRHFAATNSALRAPRPGEKRVVFMGDSITELWEQGDPAFFARVDFINRGISGQTTSQMLVRFRQDVIELKPAVVHILAGTNDIAENTGPTSLGAIEANIESMIDIAEANGVRVALGSVLPATEFWWHRGLNPGPKIVALNAQLRRLAVRRRIVYVDYYTALTDGALGMRLDFAPDGIHPSLKGYQIMGPMVTAAIKRAERLPPSRPR
jgi:acyl-CoA thioesterase-1